MIFRIQRDTNFTNINNKVFEEKKLSLPAMGLLCYLLSKPKEWEVLPRVLCEKLNKKANSKAGYEYILSLLKELQEAFFIHKKRKYDGNMEYFVFDEPNPDFTYSVKNLIGNLPNREKPNRENDDTYKEKNIHKEKSINKKEKSSPNSSSEDLDHFEIFWNIYPRKEAKKKSKDIFIKLSKTNQQRIIKLTELFKADMEDLGRTRTLIMLPTTYLTQERYEDYAENTELSKTNEGAIFESNDVPSKAEILSNKIKSCIKTFEGRGPDAIKSFKYEEIKSNEKENFFDDDELTILAHMGATLEDYKNMEFQPGEIKRYLGGAIC